MIQFSNEKTDVDGIIKYNWNIKGNSDFISSKPMFSAEKNTTYVAYTFFMSPECDQDLPSATHFREEDAIELAAEKVKQDFIDYLKNNNWRF